MADKLFVDIGASTEGLKQGLKDAEKDVKDFGRTTEETFEKAGESTNEISSGVGNATDAMRLLNRETKGLGTGWIKVAKASKVGGVAMKTALISSGIGLLLLALIEVVARWDDIKTIIFESERQLKAYNDQMDRMDRNQEILDRHLGRVKALQKLYGLIGKDLDKLNIAEEKNLRQSLQGLEERRKASETEYNRIAEIIRTSSFAFDIFGNKEEKLRENLALSKKEFEETGIEIIGLKTQLLLLNESANGVVITVPKATKVIKDLGDQANTTSDIFKDNPFAQLLRFDAQNEFTDSVNQYKQYFKDVGAEIETFNATLPFLDVPKIDPEKVEAETQAVVQVVDNFASQMKSLVAGQLSSAFFGIGEMIGNALSGAGDTASSLGDRLLGFFGNLLTEFGALLITIGTGIVIADIAFKSGNGYAAIAAGVAMVALGVLLTSKMNKGVQMANGGSSTSGSVGGAGSSNFTGSSTSGNNGGGGGTYVFEIQGTKLVGVLANTLARNKALGGSLSLNT